MSETQTALERLREHLESGGALDGVVLLALLDIAEAAQESLPAMEWAAAYLNEDGHQAAYSDLHSAHEKVFARLASLDESGP